MYASNHEPRKTHPDVCNEMFASPFAFMRLIVCSVYFSVAMRPPFPAMIFRWITSSFSLPHCLLLGFIIRPEPTLCCVDFSSLFLPSPFASSCIAHSIASLFFHSTPCLPKSILRQYYLFEPLGTSSIANNVKYKIQSFDYSNEPVSLIILLFLSKASVPAGGWRLAATLNAS